MSRVGRVGDGGVLLFLLAVLAVEVAVGWARHRTEDELREVVDADASARETIAAIHALANRDQPRGFSKKLVRKMLSSPHAEVRELAMTTNVTRLTGPQMQTMHRRAHGDSAAAFRYEFFERYHEHLLTPELLARYYRSLP